MFTLHLQTGRGDAGCTPRAFPIPLPNCGMGGTKNGDQRSGPREKGAIETTDIRPKPNLVVSVELWALVSTEGEHLSTK